MDSAGHVTKTSPLQAPHQYLRVKCEELLEKRHFWKNNTYF